MLMKLGFISQWYDPEEGSAAVPGSIARSLQRRGLQTRVITGFPNYPYGRIYPAYRQRWPYREMLDDIEVHRVPLYPSHERSASKRTASYLSFAGSASVLGLRPLLGCDVGLVYSTPATTAMPALAAQLAARVPFVVFIQDLWPETVLASGLLRSHRVANGLGRVLGSFCQHVYRQAGRIAVISQGMRQLLIDRGVPANKIETVYNWVDEAIFRPTELDQTVQDSLGLTGGFSAMYAGSLGDLQNLEVAIDAAALLHDLPDFTLVLVGSGVAEPRLRAKVADLGLKNVIFAGQRPLGEMASLLRSADVQLVTLQDLPLFHGTVPSKVQSVLACGRPLVTSAPGDVGGIVDRSGAGIACPPDDPQALAAALRSLNDLRPAERDALGASGRRFYESELSESVGSERLTALLQEVAR